MSDASAVVSRWSRRSVFAGALFLLASQAASALGAPQRGVVVLGVYGFVLHVVFGKAYALVPTYFDRTLVAPRAPAVQLPLTGVGAVALAVAAWCTDDGCSLAPTAADAVGLAGAVGWTVGVGVFAGTLLWTTRDNLSGAETATGEANAHRRPVDRFANVFVPVALAYLLAGTYGTLALHVGVPPLVDGYPPRTSHLLAAGAAATTLFAVGFRLLPRFFVAEPPRPLAWTILPAGALAPALLASSLPAGPAFVAGAALEAVAVGGFALTVLWLFARSDRRRVGFYGVGAGAACGVLGVVLGLWFATVGASPAAVAAHLRLNVVGFLGLTIVGVTFQFYPPAVGTFPGASDRTALAVLASLLAGLLVQASGFVRLGGVVGLVGAGAYVWLLAGLFRERYG